MSYQKPNTGNAMNDYFSRVRDFNLTVKHLLRARNKQSFEIWLDKLMQIDKRSLILYLRKQKAMIPPEYWERAKARLPLLEKGGDR